jgi:hypothetical protein
MITSAIEVYQVFVKNTRFNWIRQLLVNQLQHSTDLQVKWKIDHQGRSYLEIYDPTRATRNYFDSEAAARVWLEKRYNE